VAEIISRHQQAQAVQDGLLSPRRKCEHGTTFPQHRLDSGFDVMTENRFFVEGKKQREELSFR
jgi:hypothetical protein